MADRDARSAPGGREVQAASRGDRTADGQGLPMRTKSKACASIEQRSPIDILCRYRPPALSVPDNLFIVHLGASGASACPCAKDGELQPRAADRGGERIERSSGAANGPKALPRSLQPGWRTTSFARPARSPSATAFVRVGQRPALPSGQAWLLLATAAHPMVRFAATGNQPWRCVTRIVAANWPVPVRREGADSRPQFEWRPGGPFRSGAVKRDLRQARLQPDIEARQGRSCSPLGAGSARQSLA